jgi:hypothetical protein
MGVDYAKCEKCKDCLNTQDFPNCFCCDNMIDDLCCDCVPDHNCVDEKHEDYMCDDCIQNSTDDEIKQHADNYYVKNVNKIIKRVKKLRKTHFTKDEQLKKLKNKRRSIVILYSELKGDLEDINKEISLLE